MLYKNLIVKDLEHSNQYLLSFISILVYLLPISLVSGPFLPDLFISLIGLILLLVLIKKKI